MAHAGGAPSVRLVALCVLYAGCGPTALVPLTAATPITNTPSAPLEVSTRSVGVRDPLRLSGTRVAFAGLEEPLGHAVSTAVVPWALARRDERPEGWQLLVELIQAQVSQRERQVIVTLGVRATLRTRRGNVYLAQTQAHCKQAALVGPQEAAPVFYRCMTNLGRELAGWLGGVSP
jgi:hypothetical protein